MSRSEFKKGDTVRVLEESRGQSDLLDVDLEVIAVYGPSQGYSCDYLDVRTPVGGEYQFWRAERFELVQPSSPTINPDEWTERRSIKARHAGDYGSMQVLCAWTFTNLAPVLLAGWAHRDPEPTVTVELPRPVVEHLAGRWIDPRWPITSAVGAACKAALEQEARNG